MELLILTNQSKAQELYFIENNFIEIKKSNSFALEVPVEVVLDGNGDLFLCNNNSVAKFDAEGNLMVHRKPYGRGPGELMIVGDCTLDEQYLIIYDAEKRENLWFEKDSLNFVSSMIVKENDTREMISTGTNLYSLNKSSFGFQTNALSEFNLDSSSEVTLNPKVPEYAFLGSTRNGGGMAYSESNDIFFGFIPYPTIWKYNINDDKLSIIEVLTDDYVQIEERKALSFGNNHFDHIAYTFSISRFMGLFFIEPNIIVRMVEHGNPWEGEQVQIVLDFIDESGDLIMQRKIDHRVFFSKGNYLFIEKDWDKLLREYDSLEENETLQIFDTLEFK